MFSPRGGSHVRAKASSPPAEPLQLDENGRRHAATASSFKVDMCPAFTAKAKALPKALRALRHKLKQTQKEKAEVEAELQVTQERLEETALQVAELTKNGQQGRESAKNQVEALQNRVRSLVRELGEKDRGGAATREQLMSTEQEVNRLRTELHKAGEQRDEELGMANEQKQEALRQLQEHITRQARAQDAANQLEEISSELQRCKVALKQRDQAIGELRGRCEEMERQLRARDASEGSVRQEFADEKENLMESGAKMQTEMKQMHAHIELMQSKCGELEETCLRLRTDLKNRSLDHEHLQQVAEQYSLEARDGRREAEALGSRLTQAEHARDAACRQGAEAALRVQQLEAAVQEQGGRDVALRGQLDTAREQLEGLRREFVAYQDQAQAREHELAAARAHLKQQQYESDEHSAAAHSLKASLKQQEMGFVRQMDAIQEQTVGLERRSEELERELARCRAEGEEHRRVAGEWERRFVECEAGRRVQEGLEATLETSQEHARSLEAELKGTRVRLEQLAQRCTVLEGAAAQSASAHAAALQEARARTEGLSRRCTALEGEKAALEGEAASLRARLSDARVAVEQVIGAESDSERECRSRLTIALHRITQEQIAHARTREELRNLRGLAAEMGAVYHIRAPAHDY